MFSATPTTCSARRTSSNLSVPELQYIIHHVCLQLLLYDKYLTEGKDKVMALHTMKAHWEWKHGSTHSYTRR